MNKTLEYFNENELSTSVYLSKYAMRDNDGNVLEPTPDDMHERLAQEFYKMEMKYDNPMSLDYIRGLLKDFKYIIPQGSVMSQLGHKYQIGSLSNCIVLPKLYDSYGGIMYADQQLTQLMKRRCGVGSDLSTIRPQKSKVTNSAGTSTGVVSFMERFSSTTREVAQNGRRGALMLTIDIKHPDVKDFALSKQDLTKVTGANISILISDEFMNAVKNDTTFVHQFPVGVEGVIPSNYEDYTKNELHDGMISGSYFKIVDAKDLWKTIIECAWNTAEPGLIFWDRQHIYSPSSIYPKYKNISTNPCSEIAMSNDSCRLIAHNLFSYIKNPFTKNAYFDFELFKEHVRAGMRLMDDLVDLELEAIKKILAKIDTDPEPDHIKAVERETWTTLYNMGKSGRRTGFGFTALGDTLAGLGLKYDSNEGIAMTNLIGRAKLEAELESMIQMAKERGTFEDFDSELEYNDSHNPDSYLHMIKTEFPHLFEEMMTYGRRNISWSTVAPTGSLSMLSRILRGFNTTSGIEPMFNVKPNEAWFVRRKKINPNDVNARVDYVDAMGDKWTEFRVFHQGFIEWAFINHPDVDLQQISKEELVNLLNESPYSGSGASEISWEKRVEIQATIQKYISHSISSTINLPSDVDKQVIDDLYFKSWELGLKGITVYRDGCRSGVLVSESAPKTSELVFEYKDAPKRPRVLECELFTPVAKGKRWLVLVGLHHGKPYEVFAFPYTEDLKTVSSYHSGTLEKQKSGTYNLVTAGGTLLDIASLFEKDEEEALTRLISTALRHGADIKFVCQQLDKSYGTIVSFNKAIARTLRKYTKDHVVEVVNERMCDDTEKECVVVREEGCTKCLTCGMAKCA